MSRLAMLRRIAATLLIALWWGGFSFYSGRVVFIGHEILRSKVRQGFITERVTTELNWLALVTLGMVGWELIACAPIPRRRVTWMTWAVTLLATVTLILLHAKLAAMLDFNSRQVTDDNRFYDWHRVYLCVATVQWLAGGTLLVLFRNSLCPAKVIQADPG
jgi:hypothetical protein